VFRNLFFAAAITLTITGCAGSEAGEMAEVVYMNGRIYTVNEAQPWADAVAIKDGKFLVVGSNADVEAVTGDSTEVLDLGNQMVLPGLHDVHVHPYESGLAYLKCKLPGTLDSPTWQDLLDTLEECRPRQEQGWFYGEGYTAAVIPEGKYTRETLDEIFPDQPVLLQDESGHNGWVNSKAIEVAGVTTETSLPPGNALGVDQVTGELNGQVIEIGALQVFKDVIPPDSDETKRDGLKLAMRMANENGLTSWFEAWTLEASLPIWDDLARAGELTVHTRLAPLAIGFDGVAMDGPEIKALVEAYELPGIAYGAKIFTDGTLEGGTAGMLAPSGPNNDLGSTTVDEETFERVVRSLDAAGIQVKAHTIGDRANGMILEVLERVIADRGNNELRHHIGHVAHLHPDYYPRYVESGIPVESNIAQAAPMLYMTNVIKPVTPPDVWEHHTFPFGKLVNAGACLAGASDWSSLPFDPFYAMGAAVTRTDPKRPDLGAWSEENRMTVEQIIRAYTINGAHIMHQDDETGSIEEGKWADMVVTSQNLFEIEPMEIFKTSVIRTVFKGRVVYERQ